MEINARENKGEKSCNECLYLIENYARRVPNVNEKIKKKKRKCRSRLAI